jgi:hypothetical protein
MESLGQRHNGNSDEYMTCDVMPISFQCWFTYELRHLRVAVQHVIHGIRGRTPARLMCQHCGSALDVWSDITVRRRDGRRWSEN